MSERVICEAECDVVMLGGRRVQRCSYEPDPEAPRVDEIVKSLLKGREAMVRMMEEVVCTSHQERELAQIDALISRLEDT